MVLFQRNLKHIRRNIILLHVIPCTLFNLFIHFLLFHFPHPSFFPQQSFTSFPTTIGFFSPPPHFFSPAVLYFLPHNHSIFLPPSFYPPAVLYLMRHNHVFFPEKFYGCREAGRKLLGKKMREWGKFKKRRNWYTPSYFSPQILSFLYFFPSSHFPP